MNLLRYFGIIALLLFMSSCGIFKHIGHAKRGNITQADTVQVDTAKKARANPHIINSNETIADFVMDYVNIKYKKLKRKINFDPMILVSINKQRLYLIKNRTIIRTYIVSTAANGVGDKNGSDKTPLGLHIIKKKIGKGVPLDGRFVSRIYTGHLATIHKDTTHSKTDDVTTRIMWLQGEEHGINRGKGVDSFKRDIYIHGTSEEGLLGKPASHGCIRMSNKAVADLFSIVSTGTPVLIVKY